MRSNDAEIIFQHAITVHAATVAGHTAADLMGGAIKTEHLMSPLLCPRNETVRQVIRVAVPSGASCQYYNLHFIFIFSKQFICGCY